MRVESAALDQNTFIAEQNKAVMCEEQQWATPTQPKTNKKNICVGNTNINNEKIMNYISEVKCPQT